MLRLVLRSIQVIVLENPAVGTLAADNLVVGSPGVAFVGCTVAAVDTAAGRARTLGFAFETGCCSAALVAHRLLGSAASVVGFVVQGHTAVIDCRLVVLVGSLVSCMLGAAVPAERTRRR